MFKVITNPIEELLVVQRVRLATCDLVKKVNVIDLCATRECLIARETHTKALREAGVIAPEDINLYEDGV